MLVGLTGRLVQEPCDNKVKPVEPAQTLGSFENQGFMELLSKESVCAMLRGAMQVPKPEAANKWARKDWREKSFSFQQNLRISSQCKALSSVLRQSSLLLNLGQVFPNCS